MMPSLPYDYKTGGFSSTARTIYKTNCREWCSFALSFSGVTTVNEICQLETMEARCRWNSEVIVITSARWGRMKTGRCINIHSKLMALNSKDPMFLGCSEDVLSLLDMKCSLQPACDVVVPNPDLDKITPCYEDLTRYLEASYTCVKGKFSN